MINEGLELEGLTLEEKENITPVKKEPKEETKEIPQSPSSKMIKEVIQYQFLSTKNLHSRLIIVKNLIQNMI